MLETCPRCGQMRHPKGCPKRKRSGKHSPRPIISFDCETVAGIGITLFLASGGDRNASWLYAADGLKVETILEWIVTTGAGRLSFGFFFNYDVNQIVALLPYLHQTQIAARGRVQYKRWRLSHTPGKKFTVGDVEIGQSATIWDCSGWAQCSFAKLTEDWKLGSADERALVKAMKERRNDFVNATEAELIQYTTLECALLSDWAQTILTLHDECGIHLRAYSGPGSTAGAMIRQRGWKPPEIPEHINTIATEAFFGGRSEISCVGPVPGPIHSYDINSAYPNAITALPELRDAKWYHTSRYVPGGWGFYRVRWKQKPSSCWGLFPVRGAMLPSGHRSVSLMYPTRGEGWFHSNEILAGLDVEPDAVKILEGWIVEPKGTPFEWVRAGCEERIKYKFAKDMRHFPLKVGYNSIYGKLAQHTGSHPLQCLAYAGAVTAQTRGELLRKAHPHGHDVLLLATDGILSKCLLPECEIGPNLGQWEYQQYPDAWLLQAGVYWAGNKKRTRGIDARGLNLDDVKREWTANKTNGEIELQARRVLSYRLCAAQNKLDQTGQWVESVRKVGFSPAPRRKGYRWNGACLQTIPARVEDYRKENILDQFFVDMNVGSEYDELDGLPDWAYRDE